MIFFLYNISFANKNDNLLCNSTFIRGYDCKKPTCYVKAFQKCGALGSQQAGVSNLAVSLSCHTRVCHVTKAHFVLRAQSKAGGSAVNLAAEYARARPPLVERHLASSLKLANETIIYIK